MHGNGLQPLASAMTGRAYEDRQVIFCEGTRCEGLFIVKSGQVKLLRSSQGKEQLLEILGKNDPLDLVPFLDGGSYTFTACARGPARLYFVGGGKAESRRDLHPPDALSA